jgi:hypothetical protein
MKKGIGPQGLGASKSPAKMYGAKSPAKAVEIVVKKKNDSTLNEKYLKSEQERSNSEGVRQSITKNFGVKKPKANIK